MCTVSGNHYPSLLGKGCGVSPIQSVVYHVSNVYVVYCVMSLNCLSCSGQTDYDKWQLCHALTEYLGRRRCQHHLRPQESLMRMWV